MNRDDSSAIRAGHGWIWGPPLVLACAAVAVRLTGSNRDLFAWINGWHTVTGDNYWALLTILSDGVVSFAVMLPWIRKRPRNIWAILVASIIFTIVSQFTKHMMRVPRPPRVLSPDMIHVIGPRYMGNSFPSGHASMIFTMAGVWALSSRTAWIRAAMIFFASLVALSRVAVGVHWPLDILVGGAIGWALGWAGLALSRVTPWGYGPRAGKLMGAGMILCGLVLFFPYCGFTEILWEQRTLALVVLLVGTREYARLFQRGENPAS
ncbi:MAG: phosphatase PAP2 family protein [Lentisphaerae bacterium]|nr:phosphatase PAP2 family protein [Lentisphaerota bacterium]